MPDHVPVAEVVPLLVLATLTDELPGPVPLLEPEGPVEL
jgi:hypothetical protein